MFIFEELLEIDANADFRAVCSRLDVAGGGRHYQPDRWRGVADARDYAKEDDIA